MDALEILGNAKNVWDLLHTAGVGRRVITKEEQEQQKVA